MSAGSGSLSASGGGPASSVHDVEESAGFQGGSRESRDGLATIACLLVLATVFALDVCCRRGIAVGVVYVVAVLLSVWDRRAGFTIAVTVGSVVLVVLGFSLSPPGMPWTESLANRFLAIGAIGAVGVLSLQRESLLRDREKVVFERYEALEKLKILRGCLPICAGCQRIRDSAGRWVVLESYISAHSEADFTHGMCDDCIRRLYPEMADAILQDKEKSGHGA